MRMDNKVVPSFAVGEAGECCHVHILDIYFKKVPREAIAKGNFYLRPLSKVPNDLNAPWFTCAPMENTLQSLVEWHGGQIIVCVLHEHQRCFMPAFQRK